MRIVLLTLAAAVLAAMSYAADALPQPLSQTDIKLLHEFVSRVNEDVNTARRCISEIDEYNEEGFECVVHARKMRILNGYYVRIFRIDADSLNNAIVFDARLSRGFNNYYILVGLDSKINQMLRGVKSEKR